MPRPLIERRASLWAAVALASVLGPAPLAAQETGSIRLSVGDRVSAAEGDVRDGEADVVAQARAALDEARRRRAAGDEAGAVRAERIATAALALVDARRAHREAAAELDAARERRAAADARRERAREARAAAARERDRLDGTGAP